MRTCDWFFRPSVLVLSLAVALLPEGGCSTFKGQKLGSLDNKEVAPQGIPFTLVRPVFAVSSAAPASSASAPAGAASAPQFTLAVTYEPDPAQRYTLKIDPSYFSDANFAMKFGTGGTLVATTASVTETVTPAITAIGSFAANVIGGLSLATLDRGSPRTIIVGQFDKVDECKKPQSDVMQSPIPASSATDEEPKGTGGNKVKPPGAQPAAIPSVGAELARRAKDYKDDTEFAASFAYYTEREHTCLIAALKDLKSTEEKPGQGNLDRWTNARKVYATAHKGDTELNFLAQADAAVNQDDKKLFDRLDQDNQELSKTNQALANDRDVLLGSAKLAAKAVTASAALKELDLFANMDAPTWLARHVLYLERELAKIDLARLRRPDLVRNSDSRTALDAAQRSLQLERARTLGVVPQYDRSLLLTDFLREIPEDTSRGGRAPAIVAYVAARTELDALLAQIDARRSRVVSDAQPASKAVAVPALSAASVPMVSQDTIAASKQPGWYDGAGKTMPQFVLVLEERK